MPAIYEAAVESNCICIASQYLHMLVKFWQGPFIYDAPCYTPLILYALVEDNLGCVNFYQLDIPVMYWQRHFIHPVAVDAINFRDPSAELHM